MFDPPIDANPTRTGLGSARNRSVGDGTLADLEFEVERLRIIAEALWRILKEKHALDDQELIRQVTLIDLADGKLDGRVAPTPPGPCPKCGRTLAKTRFRELADAA